MNKYIDLGDGLSASIGIEPKTDEFRIVLRNSKKDGRDMKKLLLLVTQEALVPIGEGEEMHAKFINSKD